MRYICSVIIDKKETMNTTRIYISADKTKATVVTVSRTRSTEREYRIKGERWVTPLEEIIKSYPAATVLHER